MSEIIIAKSEIEGATYFIFRPINDNQYTEIKVCVDAFKKTIKSSLKLTLDEYHYITKNIAKGSLSTLNRVEIYNHPEYIYEKQVFKYSA